MPLHVTEPLPIYQWNYKTEFKKPSNTEGRPRGIRGIANRRPLALRANLLTVNAECCLIIGNADAS